MTNLKLFKFAITISAFTLFFGCKTMEQALYESGQIVEKIGKSMQGEGRAGAAVQSKKKSNTNVKVISSRYSKPVAKKAQQLLVQTGYLNGAVDGQWGGQSRKAMKNFQASESLTVLENKAKAESYSQIKKVSIQTPKEKDVYQEKAAPQPIKKVIGKRVIASSTDLLTAPDFFADFIVLIPSGSELNVEELIGDFAKVTYKGTVGYIDSSLLK